VKGEPGQDPCPQSPGGGVRKGKGTRKRKSEWSQGGRGAYKGKAWQNLLCITGKKRRRKDLKEREKAERNLTGEKKGNGVT